MKKLTLLKYVFLFTLTISINSCSDDEEVVPPPTNEEELITTVKVTLTSGGTNIILQSKDLDGDGPNAPVITVSGNLTANTNYTGVVEFLNESVNPVVNITEEVEEEGNEHQVFYQKASNLGTINYTDVDSNNKPIGLSFTYQTGNTTNGNLTVTLRHLPNKNANGVASGDITNAGGSTDAEATFPINVQ